MQSKTFSNSFINFLLSVLMSFSLIYALTTSLNFTYSAIQVFLLSAFFTFIFTLMFYNKRFFLISLVLLLSIMILAAAVFSIPMLSGAQDLINLAQWTLSYVSGVESLNNVYADQLTLLLSFFISLLVYLLSAKKVRFLPLLLGGMGIFIVQWIYELFVSYVPLYLFLVLILVYYFKHIYHKQASNENHHLSNPAVFCLLVLPICMLTVFLAYKAPVNTKPIEWKWLDTKILKWSKEMKLRFSGTTVFEEFSLAETGFGGSTGVLGGKVKLDKTVVLKVQAPKRIYLRGASYDVYTGNAWKSTNETQMNIIDSSSFDYKIDSNVFLYGLQIFQHSRNFEKYFNEKKVNITFENLKTKALFTPIKVQGIIPYDGEQTPIYYKPNEVFSLAELKGKNFGYTAEYYDMDWSDPDFQTAARKSNSGIYNVLHEKISQLYALTTAEAKKVYEDKDVQGVTYVSKGVELQNLTHYKVYIILVKNLENHENSINVQDLINNKIKEISEKETWPYELFIVRNKESLDSLNHYTADYFRFLSEHSSAIRSKYLQLPAALPDRVKQLAYDLTSKEDNNYDKVKAIEQFLSSKYPYTLSPKKTPKNRDFIDYFLFDLKKGYCTYYASAMTIMVRSLGIPARYVEGFVLPRDPKTDNTYYVTNQQAHAWVEVYLDGFGWIPFEPTATFRATLYGILSGTAAGSNSAQNFTPNLPDYLNKFEKTEDASSNTAPSTSAKNAVVKNKSMMNPRLLIIIAFGAILLLFTVIIITNSVKVKLKYRKMASLPPKEGIIAFYGYFLQLLALQKLKMRDGETPLQYAERVDTYMLLLPVNFKTITEVFIKARYGNIKMHGNEKKLILDFYRQMIENTKKELGKLKYFINEYLLGRL